ncbi:MAG TPA: choice-of-anchor A family protein [Chloroflexia bacterium]|nr:choice-of-anchor A family protein [Chloroflexia bacterium]
MLRSNRFRRLNSGLLALLLTFSLLVCFSTTASASPDTVIDTFSQYNQSSIGVSTRTEGFVGQIITVPAGDSALHSFTVAVPLPSGVSLLGRIYPWGDTRPSGQSVWEEMATVSSTFFTQNGSHKYYLITFDTGNLKLNAGAKYIFVVKLGGFNGTLAAANNVYNGGYAASIATLDPAEIVNNQWYNYPNFDIAFKAVFVAPPATLPTPLPTEFNVLSLGGLNMTSSEVQGQLGAGGNSTFNGTNLGTTNPQADAVLVQGNAAFNNWGNQVNGNVVYSGSLSPAYLTFARGGLVQKSSVLPIAALTSYAQTASDAWAALTPNGTTDVKPWGQIILKGTDITRNVFVVDGAQLSVTNSLVIDAPASSEVIVNVTGNTTRMQYMGVQLIGVNPAKLVYNIRSTTTFSVNGVGLQGLVWAALADVNFTNAQLKGTLVGKSVTDTNGRFESLPYQGTLPALN